MAPDVTKYKFAALAQRVLVSALVVVGGSATAMWLWPDGLTDGPISSITLGAFIYALGGAIAALISIIVLIGVWSDWS